MIGLPGETDVDVLGIAETVAWLQRECRDRSRKPLAFNLTISNFTPKPHTPFQWHSVSTGEFQRKQELLRQECRHMRGVKVNFTDVRISAMEDFIGRGDRRLSVVLRRAWELGAGMDSWYDSVERAYNAWGQAIAESGLTWKYRQVEQGEWNLMQGSREQGAESRGKRAEGAEGAREKSQVNPTPHALDRPLPWDRIDTGIEKKWLKEDLQRAMEAATVPDCSFDGCSHCGVCGIDFGHNIVIEPPPIPQFAGQYVPNNTKVQRLRLRFGKLGDMALVSHLDLMRLFDPVSFTAGFSPSPRISVALALPLGVTSSGEIVDFELTQIVEPAVFRQQLSSQLPTDIPIYDAIALDLKAPAAMKTLTGAEYVLTIAVTQTTTPTQQQEWVETIKNSTEIWWEQMTKSKKTYQVNLRDRLFELELVPPHNPDTGEPDNTFNLRYTGSCSQDGNHLKPEHVTFMLEQVACQEIQLLHIHRQQLILDKQW